MRLTLAIALTMACKDRTLDLPRAGPETVGDTWSPDTAITECEGTDADGDGWCEELDCDDTDPWVHPGQWDDCNANDDDCDGTVDEDGALSTFHRDADGDGYGADDSELRACSRPQGYTISAGDCDDTNAQVHPQANEVCGDGLDNDCSGGDAAC